MDYTHTNWSTTSSIDNIELLNAGHADEDESRRGHEELNSQDHRKTNDPNASTSLPSQRGTANDSITVLCTNTTNTNIGQN